MELYALNGGTAQRWRIEAIAAYDLLQRLEIVRANCRTSSLFVMLTTAVDKLYKFGVRTVRVVIYLNEKLVSFVGAGSDGGDESFCLMRWLFRS